MEVAVWPLTSVTAPRGGLGRAAIWVKLLSSAFSSRFVWLYYQYLAQFTNDSVELLSFSQENWGLQ